jgi:glycosyltransferase involved in cell wall biosynthesis
MNAADALLLTSKHEGSPNTVKEALACNLPIVTTDVGDVRERLARVRGCAIVPSEDPAALARHLTEVLRQNQRTNGWDVVQELSEAHLVQRQIKVYQSAIERYQ